jgi:hypothetical protein
MEQLPPSPTPSCSSKLSDTEKRVLEPYDDDHEVEEGEIVEERPVLEGGAGANTVAEEIQWCEGSINSLTVTKENHTAIQLQYCKESGEIRIQTDSEFAVSYEDLVQYLDEVTGNTRKKQLKDAFERLEEERDEEFDDICFYSMMIITFTVALILSVFIGVNA